MSVLFFFITNFTFWLVISPTLASTYPTTVIFVLFSCFMYVNFVIVQYRSKCHFAHSLLKKSPYSELFLLAFFPHFLAFGLNTERYSVSLRIHSECGKMPTRITPNTDPFYVVGSSGKVCLTAETSPCDQCVSA